MIIAWLLQDGLWFLSYYLEGILRCIQVPGQAKTPRHFAQCSRALELGAGRFIWILVVCWLMNWWIDLIAELIRSDAENLRGTGLNGSGHRCTLGKRTGKAHWENNNNNYNGMRFQPRQWIFQMKWNEWHAKKKGETKNDNTIGNDAAVEMTTPTAVRSAEQLTAGFSAGHDRV